MWNQNQRRIAHLPTDVYRVYDALGQLLYVGVSTNVFYRMHDHKMYSAWWHLADSGIVSRYENRYIARKVEALAIRDESPLYNVTREHSEARRSELVTEPVEVLSLFWEQGKVWVDADAERQTALHDVPD